MHPQPEQHNGTDPQREALRAEVAKTCAHLANRLETLQSQVLKPVEDAHEVIQTTVGAAQSAVDTTRQACESLRHCVEQRPWMMAGAGIALGTAAGYLLSSKPSPNAGLTAARSVTTPSSPSALGDATKRVASIALGVGMSLARDWLTDLFPHFKEPIQKAVQEVSDRMGLVRFENRFLGSLETEQASDALQHPRFRVNA